MAMLEHCWEEVLRFLGDDSVARVGSTCTPKTQFSSIRSPCGYSSGYIIAAQGKTNFILSSLFRNSQHFVCHLKKPNFFRSPFIEALSVPFQPRAAFLA